MALPFCRRKDSFLSMFGVPNLESPTSWNLSKLMGLPMTWLTDLKIFKPKGWVPSPLFGLNLNENQTGQSGPYCKLRPSRVPYF